MVHPFECLFGAGLFHGGAQRAYNRMRGRGAFRRFKESLYEAAIEEHWYAYRDQALKELAADFLEAEGIPVSDG